MIRISESLMHSACMMTVLVLTLSLLVVTAMTNTNVSNPPRHFSMYTIPGTKETRLDKTGQTSSMIGITLNPEI
jgi:hypothetical protein